jgi:8-oxo-dGTP pyrophosphatase MutT (NUDIX family)
MLESKTAGGIVLNKDGVILVVNQNYNSWSFPKGHIEDGEEVLAAAKREIEEETGITHLEYLGELGTYSRYKIGKNVDEEDKSEIKYITMFLFRTDQMKLQPIDPDNPEARWVAREEVVDLLTHKKDKEFWLSVKDKLD